MVIILQIPDHQYLKSNKKKKTVQSNEFNLYEETIEQLKIIKEAVRTVAENTSQIAVSVGSLAESTKEISNTLRSLVEKHTFF